ncbi:MAG: GFA family protein [Candidatus Porifericomitaceae bacterium WSBS_2022_MAG_OTU9]
MSETIKTKLSCLCGSVEIQVLSMSPDVGACHCSMCRKWTGGPFLVVDCNTEVKISGEANVSTYTSSEWAARGFCSKCGTHLFYKLKQSGQYMIPPGLFDESLKLNFTHQIFIEEKPEYYSFANETKNMTGEEVFAQFSGEQSDNK